MIRRPLLALALLLPLTVPVYAAEDEQPVIVRAGLVATRDAGGGNKAARDDMPPTVTLPKTMQVNSDKDYFLIPVTTNCQQPLKWIIPDGLSRFPPELLKDPNAVLLRGNPGTYKVQAYGALGNVASDIATCTVTIGTPPPPVPPKPPTPPEPTPSPAPIPDAGYRVLVVVKDRTLADLPPDQALALRAGSVRTFLNANCASGDGGEKEWRIWPAGADTSAETPLWQKAYARPRGPLPSILISNGATGYEGPLPKDTESLLALLNKYLPKGGK